MVLVVALALLVRGTGSSPSAASSASCTRSSAPSTTPPLAPRRGRIAAPRRTCSSFLTPPQVYRALDDACAEDIWDQMGMGCNFARFSNDHAWLVLGRSSCRHAVCSMYNISPSCSRTGMLAVRVSEIFQELDSMMLPLFHNGLDQHDQRVGRADTTFTKSLGSSV